MTEIQVLLQTLQKCANRPAMYGFYPEGTELLSQHLAHICFKIQDDTWAWASTQAVWKEIAEQLGKDHNFATPNYETFTYRQSKWGMVEEDVQAELLKIFANIWEVYWPDKITYTCTAAWVNALFLTPTLLGSPDCTDLVMSFFIGLAAKEYATEINKLYVNHCFRLRGSGSRGFQSYRTVKGWVNIAPKMDRQGYARVSEGINLVIQRLETLSGTTPG